MSVLERMNFLSDCLLVSSDGQEHEVHVAVVALHSSVLLQMFEACSSGKKQTKERVVLEDLDAEMVNAVISVMYHTGHPKSMFPGINLDNVKALVEAARKYDMPAMTAACDCFLERESPEILTFRESNIIARRPCFGILLHSSTTCQPFLAYVTAFSRWNRTREALQKGFGE